LEEKILESYTKEGKSLTEVIQEWINENYSKLYCNKEQEDIEYLK